MKPSCLHRLLFLLLAWGAFLCPGTAGAQNPWITCVNTAFREVLVAPGATLRVYDLKELPDRSLLLAGSFTEPGSNNGKTWIARCSPFGQLLWVRALDVPGVAFSNDFVQVAITAPDRFVVARRAGTAVAQGIALCRFDTGGNLLGQRSYSLGMSSLVNMSLTAGSGALYVGGYSGNGQGFVACMEADFSLRWARGLGHVAGYCPITDVAERGGALYCVGRRAAPSTTSILMKLDKATGDTLWTRAYGIGQLHTSAFQTIQVAGDTLVVSGITNEFNLQPGSNYAALWRFDTTGKLFSATGLRKTGEDALTQLTPSVYYDPVGRTGAFCSPRDTSALVYYRNDGGNIRAWRDSLQGYRYQFAYTALADAGFVSAITFWPDPNAPGRLLLYKPGPLDPLPSCALRPYDLEEVDLSLRPAHSGLTVAPLADAAFGGAPSLVTPPAIGVEPRCAGATSCTVQRMEGPLTACTHAGYTYRVPADGGCATITFSTAPGDATITQTGNGVATVRFLRAGTIKLYATAGTACGTYKDSLLVTVRPGAGGLELGPDFMLCSGSPRLLDAGPGFTSYRWQDGSTHRTLPAATPGLYWVQVTDACGATRSDSVTARAPGQATFNIGPDRMLCRGDTVWITAPAGFDQYVWGPDYAISSLSGQTVIVRPDTDTSYYVQAGIAPCQARDTLHLTVLGLPVVNLGADSSLCAGSALTLNAGSGFASYSWSTGQTTQLVSVSTVGVYGVTVTAANGCRASDSLRIVQVYPAPSVHLNRNTVWCAGGGRRLDAGAGFSAYLWQDGSAGSTLQPAGVGTYWVRVTDARGCSSSDTVRITTVAAAPAGFLPADTLICAYGLMDLRALRPFRTYRWSSGATAPVLTVSQPGTYWLEVTDAAGCPGRDSIRLAPATCVQDLQVPTGFTPNNDGKNDVLRPVLYAPLVQFDFRLYNRWGEVVFATDRPNVGWNGVYKGKVQDSGNYVWICSFQVEGGSLQVRKGSAVLIR